MMDADEKRAAVAGSVAGVLVFVLCVAWLPSLAKGVSGGLVAGVLVFFLVYAPIAGPAAGSRERRVEDAGKTGMNPRLRRFLDWPGWRPAGLMPPELEVRWIVGTVGGLVLLSVVLLLLAF
jgi:hypothetical protein